MRFARVDPTGGIHPITEVGKGSVTIKVNEVLYLYVDQFVPQQVILTTQATFSYSNLSVISVAAIKNLDLNDTGAVAAYIPITGNRAGQSIATAVVNGTTSTLTVTVS